MSNVDAYHELLTFPAGLAYLLDQWSIILESLSQDLPLLASTRQRCFSLIGKTREQVLRSDRTATPWFLNLAGLMYGKEATLENILALLGTEPPEWMDDAEFVIRAERLRSAVPTQAAAREALKGQVSAIMEDLNTKLTHARRGRRSGPGARRGRGVCRRDARGDQAHQRHRQDRPKLSGGDPATGSPATAPAARVQNGTRSTPATTAEDLDDLVEPDQTEPADVAVDVEDAVARAEVPTDDEPAPVAATTTEADEPEVVDEADQAAPADPDPERCEVEPNPEAREPGQKVRSRSQLRLRDKGAGL